MTEIETMTAPVLPVAPASEEKWRREQAAFRQMLSKLLVTHRDLYVAIHEGQVVESGPDKLEVAGRAYARFGYVPIYVTLVTDQPPKLIRISLRYLPIPKNPMSC